LLSAISQSSLPLDKKRNLAILGGECNYLFRFNGNTLEWVDENIWKLDEMRSWNETDIQQLLDIAQSSIKDCADSLRLKVQIIRKHKAVGISPVFKIKIGLVPNEIKLTRECLEEVVLASQRTLSQHPLSQKIPFCCFNGGSDVWIDIGDKSLGVSVLQRYFHNTLDGEKIWGGNTLHVGDQFMSLGGNDFKAVCLLYVELMVEKSLYDSLGCKSK
jgi:IMP and pyridine-specific 5'-nucleotidase